MVTWLYNIFIMVFYEFTKLLLAKKSQRTLFVDELLQCLWITGENIGKRRQAIHFCQHLNRPSVSHSTFKI